MNQSALELVLVKKFFPAFKSQAGHPWFSILTRTGVFRGKENHAVFPADLVSQNDEIWNLYLAIWLYFICARSILHKFGCLSGHVA